MSFWTLVPLIVTNDRSIGRKKCGMLNQRCGSLWTNMTGSATGEEREQRMAGYGQQMERNEETERWDLIYVLIRVLVL